MAETGNGFKIVRDLWAERNEGEKSWAGRSFNGYAGGKMLVRALDDDKEIIYHAHCDSDEAAELFHDWAESAFGCTITEYRQDGEWKGFIS